MMNETSHLLHGRRQLSAHPGRELLHGYTGRGVQGLAQVYGVKGKVERETLGR